MAEQTTISPVEYSNFLQSGAILSEPENQFKLIWGPFKSVLIDLRAISKTPWRQTLIYKPYFWDFLENKIKPTEFCIGSKEAILSRSELLHLSENFFFKQSLSKIRWQKEDWGDFENQFHWSQKQFSEKLLIKTVPITLKKGEVNFSIAELNEAVKNCLKSEAYGSIYGFWQNDSGFLGLSPEIIGKWCSINKNFETVALAGTQKNSNHVECEMLENFKLMKEHQIVVDDIQQSLSETTKQVNKTETQILKLPLFSHLQTRLSITTENLSEAFKLVQDIHPSAALGIYPRNSDLFKQFSRINIQKHRQNFAAPFGFINNDSLKIIASIRNFFFSNDEVTIFSGCGIVKESLLDQEVEELKQKRLSVQKMMDFNL